MHANGGYGRVSVYLHHFWATAPIRNDVPMVPPNMGNYSVFSLRLSQSLPAGSEAIPATCEALPAAFEVLPSASEAFSTVSEGLLAASEALST